MRFLVRWLFRLLVLSLVLAVAGILLKDILLREMAQRWIREATGMDVKIGRIQTGLFSPTLLIEDLTLYNLPEYGGVPLVVLPDFYAVWDVRSILRRELHLELLRLTLSELNVVESKAGQVNVAAGLDPSVIGASSPSNPQRVFGLDFKGIETLNITVGRLRYKSLRHPGQMAETQVGMKNEVFTGIRTLNDLGAIVTKILFQNGITIQGSASGSQRSGPERR